MPGSEAHFRKLLSHVKPRLQQKERWRKAAAEQHTWQTKPMSLGGWWKRHKRHKAGAWLDPELANWKQIGYGDMRTHERRKKAAKETGGSLLPSRFMTGNREFEVVKQYASQLAVALWRQKQLQLKHPAMLALCRLALAVAADQTFLPSPPPRSFPATCCHFQLSAAIYILFNLS